MVLLLDFNWLGILIFLWFIFKGFKSSNDAKRKREERRRQAPGTKKEVKNRPSSQSRRQVSPQQKQEPAPSWFPFELPQQEPRNEAPVKTEKRAKKKMAEKQYLSEKEQRPQEARPSNTAASVIQRQEERWKQTKYPVDIDRKAVVNGIIWSEILGPPRAKNKYIR
ncbi:MAG: hypothetical protein ACOWWO_12445 [Peptococcaceae bacterium]